MIYWEGTPERSGKRSRKAEREGVNFLFRAKGQQKNSIQFIKTGKDKNLNFGLGVGGGKVIQ
jgi:hypothetical protein